MSIVYPDRWTKSPIQRKDGGGPSLRLISSTSSELEFERPKLFDAARDLVAGLEPNLLVLGHADDHARGRTSEDDVAGFQRKQSRRVRDHLLWGEDEF